jgi:NTE family protein
VPPPPLELALSGGGVRAMAFHAGALKYLAERGALEHVTHVSTVSGGTLLMGLLLQVNKMRWPSSPDYLSKVLGPLEQLLTTRSLQTRALARLVLVPWNWRFSLSRANVLAKEIRRGWGIKALLHEVPQRPTWSINGTTAETGRRFRFKDGECGDRRVGHARAPDFSLARAMAMSAAFPGGIGPLTFDCRPLKWYQRNFNNGVASPGAALSPKFATLHLYDGGLYDNLGLEPLFDIATQRARTQGTVLVVSDAGAPFETTSTRGALNPRRVKRWLDITTGQQRDLRVRCFVEALRTKNVQGAYLQIGTHAVQKLSQFAPLLTGDEKDWMSANDAVAVAWHKTSLGRLTPHRFERLCRHGYETAKWNDLAFPYLLSYPTVP